MYTQETESHSLGERQRETVRKIMLKQQMVQKNKTDKWK